MSSSSSECQCNVYNYETGTGGAYGNMGNYGRMPIYPTMGHPLVYYARMPQPSKRQRSRENRKSNQNCFSKAFKWYTQEHVPYQSEPPNKTDMNGFAVWLDSKYEEFLQDSQLGNICHLKVEQTSIIGAERIPNKSCVEPRAKRFRVKSPWRRKRPASSKEAGDVIQKHHKSFHFILQPKDLTRPASECCQPSNATLASTEMPIKSTIKSQSYTIISQEYHKIEPVNVSREDHGSKQPENYADKRNRSQNISCQCSISAKVVKVNAETQYDKNTESKTSVPIPAKVVSQQCPRMCYTSNHSFSSSKPEVVASSKELKVTESSIRSIVQSQCQCSEEPMPKTDAQIQYQKIAEPAPSLSNIQGSSKMFKTCPCESDVEVENLTNFSSPITFSDDGVQTSDYSIRLEKDTLYGYPLFMKIICADKLSK